MNSRFLVLLPVAVMMFIASCGDSSTGPGIILEPKSTDQLIPLARGNFWRYRDLSGKGGERPEGQYVIHSLEGMRESYMAYAGQERGPYPSVPFVFYTSGSNAWGVTFGGIAFGTIQDEDNVSVYATIPKHPSLGEAYAGMRCVRIEEVSTPIGTFECYRFDAHNQRESYWWARGVGLVKYRTTDALGEESGNWVLESYRVQQE